MSVNTSIGLNDGMSPVFRQIYEAMRPAMEAMERMQEMVGMNVEPEFVNEARNRVEDLHNLIESVDPELEVSANADGLDDAKEAIQTMTEQLEAVTNIPPPNTDDLITEVGAVNEEFASLQRQIEETTDPIRADHLRESLARLREEFSQEEPVKMPVIPEIPSENPAEQMQWDPVEIPILFQTEGADRLKQEAEDVVSRMSGIMETQRQISETAQGMDVLPPGALESINGLTGQVKMLHTEFAGLEVQIERTSDPTQIADLNSTYERLRNELAQISDLQENFNQAMAEGDISHIQTAFNNLNSSVSNVERGLRDNIRQKQRFNDEINNGNGFFRNMLSNVSNLSGMLGGLAIFGILRQGQQWFQQNVAIADQFTTMDAQILRMAGSLEYANRLQDMIFASAQRTNTAFLETVGVVTRLNATVGDMFADHQSLVAFTETFQQSISASATSAYNAERAMQAMESAMASGVLKARDFNRLMAYSPVAVQAVADYLGVTMMQMQKIADEGYITADVFASAMLNSIDEINEKAGSIPTTWSDYMNNMQNSTLRAFQPLMTAFSNFINTDEFGALINAWTNGIKFFAAIMTGIFHIIAWGITAVAPIVEWFSNLVMNNLDWILTGAIALGIYLLLLAMKWFFVGNSAQIAGYKMMIAMIKPLLPLLKIIAVVIAIIAIFDFLGITVADVAGFIVTLIVWLGITILNIFITIGNAGIATAEWIAFAFAMGAHLAESAMFSFIRFSLNQFANFVDATGSVGTAIAQAFVGGANIAIRAINGIIDALNLIPGVDIGNVSELSWDTNISAGDNIRNLADGLDAGPAPERRDFGRMDTLDAFGTANAAGDWTRNAIGSIGDRFGDIFGGIFDNDFGDVSDFGDLAGLDQDFLDKLGRIGDGIDGTNDRLGNGLGPGREIGDIGSINDEVEISEEDIRMLRDIAERDFILNYQQLSPEISITVHNNGEEVDIEDLVEQIEDMLEEQQASALVTT